MLTSHRDSPLYTIANPESIAFFGASGHPLRMGSIMLSSLIALGYEGAVYPIHPEEKQIQGFTAYRSVDEIPAVPDLAIIVLPTNIVSRTLEECGRKGIRHAAIISGGFAESGDSGVDLQRELARIADTCGIRFLGPNCLGVVNTHLKFNPTPIQAEGPPGFVGLASQSGSFLTQMHNYLYRIGLGFSTAFSVGNEANIDLVDCIEYLGACPDTKVIALYIEGIRRGKDFIRMARSVVPRKPIVALYAGGSEAGRRAGVSHTGALAGPDEIYDSMFRQCGIIRAFNLTELFDYCLALGNLPKPAGRRVVIQTHSGGPGATAADSCGRAGLEVPALSSDTIDALKPYLPNTASLQNPVDITFSKDIMNEFREIPDVLLRDTNTDILMIYILSPHIFVKPMLERTGMKPDKAAEETVAMMDRLGDSFIEVTKKYDKPVVVYTYRSLQEQLMRSLLEKGIPAYNDPDRAARSLAALLRYYEMRERSTAS
ncbi:MAG: CoA-binding protein [Deltaproteobacteria bacterium]|nr:CoA-binding protein [Deltaproteobacteria bacterium]